MVLETEVVRRGLTGWRRRYVESRCDMMYFASRPSDLSGLTNNDWCKKGKGLLVCYSKSDDSRCGLVMLYGIRFGLCRTGFRRRAMPPQLPPVMALSEDFKSIHKDLLF